MSFRAVRSPVIDRIFALCMQLGDNDTFYVADSVAGRVVVFQRNKDNTLTQTTSISIGMSVSVLGLGIL
jgi:hypothetical protein